MRKFSMQRGDEDRREEDPRDGIATAAIDDGSRNARRHKSTSRPPHIWPEVWQALSLKKRQQATLDWPSECKSRGTNWWGEPLPAAAQTEGNRITNLRAQGFIQAAGCSAGRALAVC